MSPIYPDQKETAINVLVKAFREVPGVLWILKKDGRKQRRLRSLCIFCIDSALDKNGAFITSDRKGVALIFKNTAGQNFFNWMKNAVLLFNNCVGWVRAWSMLQRERMIQRKRIRRDHLYFWMMGVEDNSNGVRTAVEIRDFVMEKSRKLKLPIVAETTVPRNLKTYQRFGFRIYDEWQVQKENLTVWFLIREWDQNEKSHEN